MKEVILHTFLLSLLILVHVDIFSQCDTLNFPTCPSDDNSVAVLKKVGGGYQCLGEATSATNVVFEINLSEVEKVAFATLCRNASIINTGAPAVIGTLCSSTFECVNDHHFFTPPINPNFYLYEIIGVTLPSMFGISLPTVNVGMRISECGLVIPTIILPQNNAENTGTSVFLDWDDNPSATSYTVEIKEGISGSNTQSYSGISSSNLMVSLNPNTLYFWRVQANNATCYSRWDISQFWTGSANFTGSLGQVEKANSSPTQIDIYTFFDEGRYETSLDINANFQINNFGKYVLSSESSITLMPGFEANIGADFTCIINPVGATFSASIEQIICDNLVAPTVEKRTIKNITTKAVLKAVQIYPNPSNHELTVTLESSVSERANFRILNLSGQLLSQKEITLLEGWNINSLDIFHLTAGTYILQVQSETGIQQSKFVKL